MKLNSIELFNLDDVPDHIVEEVENLSLKIGAAIFEIITENPPNLSLGALSWVHACITNQLVVDTDEAIENAALQQAKALYKNIKHCRMVRKKDQEEEDQ